jgi:hypothetical protein
MRALCRRAGRAGWIAGGLVLWAVAPAAVPALAAPRPAAQGPPAAAVPAAPAAVPRTPDGHPDFSGVWQVFTTASWDIQDHHAATDVPPGLGVVVGGDIPYQPWAIEQRAKNFANRNTEDTTATCFLPGVPRITYMPYPFQIVQTPKKTTFLYEYVHATRHVYTDGSPHPKGPIEWWMGDSRGTWEGDTLMVDVVHFTDRTRFDRAGNFHSTELHVVERYRFIDRDHIDYHVTLEDSKVFTRSWEMRMTLYRRIEPGIRPLEYDCYAFDGLFRLPAPPQ